MKKFSVLIDQIYLVSIIVFTASFIMAHKDVIKAGEIFGLLTLGIESSLSVAKRTE